MALRRRWQHLRLLLGHLPALLLDRRQRALLGEMRRFCRHLPARFRPPLPQALAALTPAPGSLPPLGERQVRELADLAALLDRRSPLGLCLRRSLVRYHFLGRAGVPLELRFGARLAPPSALPERAPLLSGPLLSGPLLSGHAWTTRHGHPYFELDEDWQRFAVVFTWPDRTQGV